MKKLILLSMIAMVMPLELLAQDDMYFVPTREQAEQTVREYGLPRDTYYIGSRRSVDEYNRRGSYYEVLDSVGSDTIDFDGIAGVYPDTLYLDEPTDYRYTRRMSRFDGFEPSSEYLAGYLDGRSYWYSPWYLNSWYYSPIRYSYYGWVTTRPGAMTTTMAVGTEDGVPHTCPITTEVPGPRVPSVPAITAM